MSGLCMGHWRGLEGSIGGSCVPSSEIRRILVVGCGSLLLAWSAWGRVAGWSATESQSVAGVIATLSITLFGFMLAALSILVAVRHRPLLETMAKTGHYMVLVQTIFISSAFLFASGAFSLLCIFIGASEPVWIAIVFTLSVGLSEVLVAGYRFYRTMEFLN